MRESKVLSKNITKRFSQGSYSDLSILNSNFEVSFSQKRVGGWGGGGDAQTKYRLWYGLDIFPENNPIWFSQEVPERTQDSYSDTQPLLGDSRAEKSWFIAMWSGSFVLYLIIGTSYFYGLLVINYEFCIGVDCHDRNMKYMLFVIRHGRRVMNQ